jgi:prepilin-type N-terminal cleavage/methylation domain-containing protein
MFKVLRRMSLGNHRLRAFTLIELLVVITVIAILAGLLLSAFPSIRAKSRMAAAMSNMRQAGTAFMLYSSDNNYTLPGRLPDAPNQTNPKWPALLAGTDGTGALNVSNNYVQNVMVYIAPGDPSINPNRSDIFAFLTSNSTNNSSWIMNGYNDLGTQSNPSLQVRTVLFTSPAETILLGVQNSGASNFYMDLNDGDNKSVLNIAMYNGGSPYFFADGSARFITQKEYNGPIPSGATGKYGDWLWLADKSNAIPGGAQ